MRYLNKVGFSVKFIECDGKFKSIMNEVRYEIGMEINYANLDNNVPEAERNNTVIKYRFQIVY